MTELEKCILICIESLSAEEAAKRIHEFILEDRNLQAKLLKNPAI